MIKLKTAELKEFFKRSKHIKPNNIIPVLGFVLLDCELGTIRKTNNYAWCVHQITVEEAKKQEKVLLEERVLTALLSRTTSEDIFINVKEKKVELTDNTDKLYHSKEDPDNFNIVEVDPAKQKPVKLSIEFIEALQLAKLCCSNKDNDSAAFVYVVNKGKFTEIMSTDRFILSYRKCEEDIPSMVLSPEVCNVIAMFKEWNYSSLANYDLFDSGVTMFGFIKTEFKPLDYPNLLNRFNKENVFTVNPAEIIGFCELAIAMAPTGAFVDCKFIGNGNKKAPKLNLSYSNNNYNRANEREIDVESNFEIPVFAMTAKQLLNLLQTAPYDKLHFARVTNMCYYIFSDEDPAFMGIMQGLDVQQIAEGHKEAQKE